MSPTESPADLEDLLDDELRPALGGLHDTRRARYRVVAVYAVICLIGVVVSSLYVTFELIGGDDAWLAFLPTVAFMAGVGVLITVFAYFVHVKVPLLKQFRAELLGPVVERITPKFRDESSAEMERDEWRESGLFPDSTHQLKSEHLVAARIDDITAGFCHLHLDAGLISPSDAPSSDDGALLGHRSGFDGLFLAATPAIPTESAVIIEPRAPDAEPPATDSSIDLSKPPAVYESLRRIDGLDDKFDDRFTAYAADDTGEVSDLLCADVQQRLVDVHDAIAERGVTDGPTPPFLMSIRDEKCHVAIPRPFPAPPLRPRAPTLDGDTLVEFAHNLEFAVRLSEAVAP